MTLSLSDINSIFKQLYRRELYKVSLVFISGGACLSCVDQESDIDLGVIHNQPWCSRELKANCPVGFLSFLEQAQPTVWGLYARLFAYYIDASKIIYSTPEGLNQLQYYKAHALDAVKEFWALNGGWVDDFLDNGVFRKELYHFVYCWEIITNNRETIDRQLLLEMKRGRANATLREWLIKVKAWYDTVSNMEETYHEQI